MQRDYDIVTFDCYGTLVDWEAGISQAFADAAADTGLRLDREHLLRAYAEIEPRVQRESFRPYRDVLSETARRLAAEHGIVLTTEQARFLPDSLGRWRPFADANPTLSRLAAAGYALGILSNVDDDLLASTLQHFDVRFELIVTAEQVRAYKPSLGHFIEARRRIGDRRWLHAAQSYFHDVTPASRLGLPVAWINRKHETVVGSAVPRRELHGLTELADWLA